jgi:hypothetical protein
MVISSKGTRLLVLYEKKIIRVTTFEGTAESQKFIISLGFSPQRENIVVSIPTLPKVLS